MKTYKDFDISMFSKVVSDVGKERGFSKEQIEVALEKLLEEAKMELNTKVHCLTCGIKFPLSNLQHDCQEEDIWLYRYVKNSVENKELNPRYISKLKKKYPLHKENKRMAFRGINFQTKEEYDSFMKTIESGEVTFETITSWTLNYSYARRFARCMQKGTRTDDSIRKQELRLMYEQKANITGYKGIVLVIDLTKKIVLSDISKAFIGSMSENEVILLPGTYPAVIWCEIDKECGNTEWDEAVIQRAEQL